MLHDGGVKLMLQIARKIGCRCRPIEKLEMTLSIGKHEAPARSAWLVPALVLGCILLALAPAVLIALDDQVEGRRRLADSSPELWAELIEIAPWWIGAFFLGAAFIGTRALGSRLRRGSVARFIAPAAWWGLLATTPLFLAGIIVAIRRQSGQAEMDSQLLSQAGAAWIFGVASSAAFIGGRSLCASPRRAWWLIGTAMCGLSLALGPISFLALIPIYYGGYDHVGAPEAVRLFGAIWAIWLFILIFVAIFAGARWLFLRYTKPGSVLYLLGVAAGWIVLGWVPGFLLGIGLGINNTLHFTETAPLRDLVTPAAVVGFFCVVLLGALVSARVDGQGSVRAGLGDAPVTNRVVIGSLIVAAVVYAVLVSLIVHAMPRRATSALQLVPGDSLHNLYIFVLLVFLAPLAEELFIRGWMWTALRKSWSVRPTAWLTGGIWLAAHFGNAILAPFLLAPLAIALSTARHVGASIRAPIAIHAIYNLTILLMAFQFLRSAAR
jgi:membrane protease YdiL (CAAX protease family)